jgi:hypothetical protein
MVEREAFNILIIIALALTEDLMMTLDHIRVTGSGSWATEPLIRLG